MVRGRPRHARARSPRRACACAVVAKHDEPCPAGGGCRRPDHRYSGVGGAVRDPRRAHSLAIGRSTLRASRPSVPPFRPSPPAPPTRGGRDRRLASSTRGRSPGSLEGEVVAHRSVAAPSLAGLHLPRTGRYFCPGSTRAQQAPERPRARQSFAGFNPTPLRARARAAWSDGQRGNLVT